MEVGKYAKIALPHLQTILNSNLLVLERISKQLILDVKNGKSLFVFGSGHSGIFPLELYHRAGGPSFVIPLVADFLLPSAGPPVVRMFERTPGSVGFLLNRAEPQPGEMIWLASQSGINSASIDLALEAKKKQMRTVAFTSLIHSKSVSSRHPSQKKLFEVCDEVVDLGGVSGDAAIPVTETLSTGPLSSLGMIFLAHSVLTYVIEHLELQGVRCAYTSVNTPSGEENNRELERRAAKRDPLLR